MGKRTTLCFGAVIGLSFLYFAFKDIDAQQIWISIHKIDLSYIAAGAVFILAEFILRAVRWKFLLERNAAPKVKELFSVLMIGYFSNNIIPLRLGELVRAQFLGTNYNVNRAQAIATIVIERIFDVLMLLVLFGLCVLLYDGFPAWTRRGGLVIGTGVLGVALLLYLCRHQKQGIVSFLRASAKGNRIGEQVAGFVDNFGLGLDVLTNIKSIVVALLLSILIWTMVLSATVMVFLAFPLNLSFLAAAFVAVMVGLGMLLPAPPGNIGVYEGFTILALLPFGVAKETALTFSLILHSLELVITTSVGFACFIKEVGSTRAVTVSLWGPSK
jgi:glycosyltransferase 2 family protein